MFTQEAVISVGHSQVFRAFARLLFDFNACRVYDRLPFFHFCSDEICVTGGCAGHDVGANVAEALTHLGRTKRPRHLRVQLVDDRLRCA